MAHRGSPRPHAEASFLRLVTSDRFDIIDLVADDYERCLELIETYDDLGLRFVDASIIAVAERYRRIRKQGRATFSAR